MSNSQNNIVRCFWHGSPLSIYEKLSLQSFLNCGHAVELYAYDELDVPAGVKLCDANSIWPFSEAFAYADGPTKGSFSALSDVFRYKLLFEKGGIWADTDMLCLKSLADLPDASAGWENTHSINCALMKFSAGHPVCEELYLKADAMGKLIHHGQAGPALMTSVTSRRKEACNILPIAAFYPLNFEDAWRALVPVERAYCEQLTASSYCVHWWGSTFRYIGSPKEALPPEGSFLCEQAKLVFSDTALKTWPLESMETWIRNRQNARRVVRGENLIGRPVTNLLQSGPGIIWNDLKMIGRGAARRIRNLTKRKQLSK